MNQRLSSANQQINNWAVVSLVLGILSWLFLPVVGAIGAIILGHKAKRDIRTNVVYFSGDGLATAGLILGYVQLGVFACGLIGFLAFIGLGLSLHTAQVNPSNNVDMQNITVTTFDNQTYKLSDYQGKIVVINFWASWAKPCEEEAADLERVWQEYKDSGVIFFGLDYVDTEPEAKAYISKWGITYPNGPDVGTRISQAFGTKGVPETYILDRNGKVAKILVGPIDHATLSAIIRQLLEK
jgi:cytochrome c biogenesis protein CcmG/thiol:disulfide interchange protein DsbE